MSLTDESITEFEKQFVGLKKEFYAICAQAPEANKLRKVVDAAKEVKEHGWRHAFGETGALLNTPRLRLEQALADLAKGE